VVHLLWESLLLEGEDDRMKRPRHTPEQAVHSASSAGSFASGLGYGTAVKSRVNSVAVTATSEFFRVSNTGATTCPAMAPATSASG
jgi:hypothetical protein